MVDYKICYTEKQESISLRRIVPIHLFVASTSHFRASLAACTRSDAVPDDLSVDRYFYSVLGCIVQEFLAIMDCAPWRDSGSKRQLFFREGGGKSFGRSLFQKAEIMFSEPTDWIDLMNQMQNRWRGSSYASRKGMLMTISIISHIWYERCKQKVGEIAAGVDVVHNRILVEVGCLI
ncbi:hypothetical protein LINPERHAP2_LOCUS10790 [Linum perenne]